MRDLKSTKWIVAKGFIFAGIALATAALIFIEMPSLKVAVLVLRLQKASCLSMAMPTLSRTP